MDTASTDGIFDISNADRLGFSEVDLVQKVVDGVDLLIKVRCHYCYGCLKLFCFWFSAHILLTLLSVLSTMLRVV